MERVLVCVIASTRSQRLTFPSFKRHVLDELNGDLAVALAINEKYDYAGPLWQHAKYRWTAPDFRDYGDAFDLAQGWLCQQHKIEPPDWRLMLQIKGDWQGAIQSADPQGTSSSIQTFCRWLLLHGLQVDGVLDRYDRFVLTRSDFVRLSPHPPLSILDPGMIWVPDGEDYGGLNDRHLVVSRADVVNCLNLIEDMVLHPNQLYDEMRNQPGYYHWNNELLLAYHLKRKGIFHKVRRFPYVMYLARQLNDLSATPSEGKYQPAVGHYVKFREEYRLASAYATIIRSRADWESGAWQSFDPALANSRRDPPLRQLRYALETAYVKVLSGLRRPGRAKRLVRFLKKLLGHDPARAEAHMPRRPISR